MWKTLLFGCIGVLAMGCGTSSHGVRGGGGASSAAYSRVAGGWGGSAVERCEELLPLVEETADAHQVDRALVVGIIKVESTFRPTAVSRVGALGLMQVMPINGHKMSCGDLTDPESNIKCGIRVLKGFLRYYKDDIVYALSGYNAGFAMPNKARREGRLPKNRSYVEKVLAARAAYLRHGCGS